MTDLAPWESSGTGGAEVVRPNTERYTLPTRIPEIYKPQTEAFIAPAGNTVPQPQPTPRPLEPRGRLALTGLGIGALAGLVWAVLAYAMFSEQAPSAAMVYAGIGLVVTAVCGLVLLLEYPRIQSYRHGNFIPGILVYGSGVTLEKVVGSSGVGSIQMRTIRGVGAGVLNKIFDRSTHRSAPPEVVGLHINLGTGPEIVGIEWAAVREFRRGDIVWFQPKGPNRYLLFHKLIPYAPWTSADGEIKKHLFTELKVGGIGKVDRATTKVMGATKVLGTDINGNIVTDASQEPVRRRDTGIARPAQPPDPNQQTADDRAYRIGDPGKGVGHFDQPEQGDDYQK